MKDHNDSEQVLAYSLSSSIVLDITVAVVAFGYGVFLLDSGTVPYPWIVGSLLLGDFYFRLWRRPVRQALFFENHFEISGWGVHLDGGYELIRDVIEVKQPFGDFRSDTRVSFSVGSNHDLLVIPNRKNRKLALDIYSLLERKSRETSSLKG